MKNIVFVALFLFAATGYANRCIKCEVLKKHHELNPCQFEYYEDYLKACEEKGVEPEKIDLEQKVREQENISHPNEK